MITMKLLLKLKYFDNIFCVIFNEVAWNIVLTFKVSYTFDAGPNAFLFIQQKDLSSFLSELIEVFPSEQPNSSYIRGISSTQPDTVNKIQ